MLNVCGDGDKSQGEGCDDGNLDPGDGCSEVCVLEECGNLVVDPAETGTDAAFTKVSTIDSDLDSLFRLLPTATWAIDKVTPAAGETLPSQDVYGVGRPQNGKWDIGAAEFKP